MIAVIEEYFGGGQMRPPQKRAMMELSKLRLGRLWQITLIIIIGVLLWALFLFFTDQSFRGSSLSNFLATIVGVVVGIPIALLIAQRQQAEQELRDSAANLADKKLRQVKILSLIQTELKHTLEILNLRNVGPKDKDYYTQSPGVKYDLWNAFSASGELQWVDDIDVLATLSDAYYYLRWIAQLEGHFFDPNFYDSVVRSGGGMPAFQTIRGSRTIDSLQTITPTAIHKVEQALRDIERVLPKEQKPA
jgi:hypothetical protein